MGDTQVRLLALENRLFGLPLDAILSRLAALEQSSWQGAGGGGGNFSLTPVSRPALTGAGGIPAKAAGVAGLAEVLLYDIDPATGGVSSAETVVAWNWFPVDVAPDTEIYVTWAVNSNSVGYWLVPSEFCTGGG